MTEHTTTGGRSIKKIAVLGIQPPLTITEKGPTSRRSTSHPFAASVLAENLRKESFARGDSSTILILMRGPREERGETGFDTMAVDTTSGKVLLHEIIPASKKTMSFFDGKVSIERLNADWEKVAEMLKGLGVDSVALPCTWTSSLADAHELSTHLNGTRIVLGGTGLFTGFAKMMAEEGVFSVMGPGFGTPTLNKSLYDLLTLADPLAGPLSILHKGKGGAVVELCSESETRVASSILHKLALSGQAHESYLKLAAAYRATGTTLLPYLGENIQGDEFTKMLSTFEFTEGDSSLLEDAPSIDAYLSYGCPRECEYCTSPALRRGQSTQSEEELIRVAESISRMLDTSKKAKVSIWDENARPSDVIKFLKEIEKSFASREFSLEERKLQIVFSNGFYPKLWAAHSDTLGKAFSDFRKRMASLGVKAKIGAFFPAENWGFGEVHFYENKLDTPGVLGSKEGGGIKDLLSIFDYVSACAGMDRGLIHQSVFDSYLHHLKEGWKIFRDALGENCSLTPFFMQVFPRTALSQLPFQIFGERISPEMLESETDAFQIAQLFSFGENFGSPAFQGQSAEEYLLLLERFFQLWEGINGEKSETLRKEFGLTISAETATKLLERCSP
jgi:hypothetical protein